MISKDKTYRTRDGREVRIYATDGRGDYPVHGAIQTVTGWESHIWFKDGKSIFQDDKERPADLFEVKPRHKRTVWINVYEGGGVFAVSDPINKGENCIACIRVDLDFEEGEGL